MIKIISGLYSQIHQARNSHKNAKQGIRRQSVYKYSVYLQSRNQEWICKNSQPPKASEKDDG